MQIAAENVITEHTNTMNIITSLVVGLHTNFFTKQSKKIYRTHTKEKPYQCEVVIQNENSHSGSNLPCGSNLDQSC